VSSAANPARGLASLPAHSVLPKAPASNPLGGLRIGPETGEAMQLFLMTLAAMLLVGVLFREELGLRARRLLDRISHR
jgi:hypothetical protein